MPSMDSGREGEREVRAKAAPSRAKKQTVRRSGKKQRHLRDVTVEAVVMLLLFLLCFFMVLGSYDTGGAPGRVLGTMEWGLFGVLSHFFPLVLYFGAAFLLENRFRPLAYKKMAGVWGLFFCLCGFVQRYTDGYLSHYSVMDYYARSADYHVAGGAFGGILCMTLTSAFGQIFGVVVLVLLSLCCVIVITRRSLVDYILDVTDLIMGLGPGLSEEEREEIREEKARLKAERLEEKIARENASLDSLMQEEEEKLLEKEARREAKARKAQEEKEQRARAKQEKKEKARAAKLAREQEEAAGEEEEEEDSVAGHPELDLKAKFSPQIFGFTRKKREEAPEGEEEEDLLSPEPEPSDVEGKRLISKKEKEEAGLRKPRMNGLRSLVSELRRGLDDDEDEEEEAEEAPKPKTASKPAARPAPRVETMADAFAATEEDLGEEDDPFAQAEKARRLASQKNPSAGAKPVQLGEIGLIGDE